MRQANTREGFTEELLVSDLLRQEGFTILEQNYMVGPREVDIIAMERDVLCFIEVKSRTVKVLLGEIDILLPKKKRQNIIAVADSYCRSHTQLSYKAIRFDLALLHLPHQAEPELHYLRNAFVPTVY